MYIKRTKQPENKNSIEMDVKKILNIKLGDSVACKKIRKRIGVNDKIELALTQNGKERDKVAKMEESRYINRMKRLTWSKQGELRGLQRQGRGIHGDQVLE